MSIIIVVVYSEGSRQFFIRIISRYKSTNYKQCKAPLNIIDCLISIFRFVSVIIHNRQYNFFLLQIFELIDSSFRRTLTNLCQRFIFRLTMRRQLGITHVVVGDAFLYTFFG